MQSVRVVCCMKVLLAETPSLSLGSFLPSALIRRFLGNLDLEQLVLPALLYTPYVCGRRHCNVCGNVRVTEQRHLFILSPHATASGVCWCFSDGGSCSGYVDFGVQGVEGSVCTFMFYLLRDFVLLRHY